MRSNCRHIIPSPISLLYMLCAVLHLVLTGCGSGYSPQADQLNDKAYDFHYRNLDSTLYYSSEVLNLADASPSQRAEAVNNMAFVCVARMQYKDARQMLDSLLSGCNDKIEQLVACIQQMRICQRCSQNKLFYDYRDKAEECLERIHEEKGRLSARQRERMCYAESEYHIVVSTYYYYLGLESKAAESLDTLAHHEQTLHTDTAQLLAFLYNYGAGGSISHGSQEQIYQLEFDYLTRCYQSAKRNNYPFWQANALQAISEHLLIPGIWNALSTENRAALSYINTRNVSDLLLAGELAMQALDMFAAYGDVYQTAGAYRTLAGCYQNIAAYAMASDILHRALDADSLIGQAPDLVASISEQLSVVNAALDNKPESDRYRNMYLDLISHTQPDKAEEAQHDMLAKDDARHTVFVGILAAIMLAALLCAAYTIVRQRRDRGRINLLKSLSYPVEQWQIGQRDKLSKVQEELQILHEERQSEEILLLGRQQKYIRQRAKLSIVNSITPLVERIIVEYKRACNGTIAEEQSKYIVDLTKKIEDYNATLTQWIHIQQGELNLRIESFALQPLFDTIARNRTSFQLKGIELQVFGTEAVVKADSTLTLFMLNTIADNARRFTPQGGKVSITAVEEEKYVEISVEDNGDGMTEKQCEDLFRLNPQVPQLSADTARPDVAVRQSNHTAGSTASESRKHYGFGLVNCKGIIEKYRKLSPLFSVCDISCESTMGKGSRFFFRLPKGVVRTARLLLILLLPLTLSARTHSPSPKTAADWADSAYYANINAHYAEAMRCADKARELINKEYLRLYPQATDTLLEAGSLAHTPPEVGWLHNSADMPYEIILDIRNETAVAALALHQWERYKYNNRIYTLLYKEFTADSNINGNILALQRQIRHKNTAIIILTLLIMSVLAAMVYDYLLPRRRMKKRVAEFENMTATLTADLADEKKLRQLPRIDTTNYPPEMQQLALHIRQMLEQNIRDKSLVEDTMEQEKDQMKRLEYENQRLHVTNSVLDNCLSTLKHETMYFPSRIRLMQESNTHTAQDILELTRYYATLHSLLATQAQQLIDTTPLPAPKALYQMLIQTLKQINGRDINLILQPATDPKYTRLSAVVHIPAHLTTPTEHLFDIDQQGNIDFLLCRQIVRDIGEQTNHRGCGIVANKAGKDAAAITITLPRKLVAAGIQTAP